MATEKRLIDATPLIDECDECMSIEWNKSVYTTWAEAEEVFKLRLENAPTVDAVEVVQFNALKSLVNGEWVDCKLVQKALNIDFATGLKMFDFCRTVEWNPAPLNGQKITTKFKLKNAVEVVHGRWVDNHCTACGMMPMGEELWEHLDCAPPKMECFMEYCPDCGAKMDK